MKIAICLFLLMVCSPLLRAQTPLMQRVDYLFTALQAEMDLRRAEYAHRYTWDSLELYSIDLFEYDTLGRKLSGKSHNNYEGYTQTVFAGAERPVLKANLKDGSKNWLHFGYRPNGTLATIHTYVWDLVLLNEKQYDIDSVGLEVHERIFSEGHLRGEYVSVYDSVGHLLSLLYYGEEGRQLSRSEFYYVPGGGKEQLACIAHEQSYAGAYSEEQYVYGTDTLPERVFVLDSARNLTSERIYQYDENRRLLAWEEFENGALVSVLRFTYDAAGRPWRQIRSDPQGRTESAYIYEYDARGNDVAWLLFMRK